MSFFREHIVKRFTRSRGWSRVRREHIKKNPECAVCGKSRGLEVHHVLDFSNHPELELEPTNLMTLCRTDHLVFGHLKSWKSINPYLRYDAEVWNQKIKGRR